MEQKRIQEIHQIVARKRVLDTKIPSTQTPAFNKWVQEASEELGISCAEFAEYIQIALREAVDEVAVALDKFKMKIKKYGFV